MNAPPERSPDPCPAAKRPPPELRGGGGRAVFVATDVTVEAEVDRLVRAAGAYLAALVSARPPAPASLLPPMSARSPWA